MNNQKSYEREGILFISNAYPPNPAVGGKRIVKMRAFFETHSFDTYVVAEIYNSGKGISSSGEDERAVYVRSYTNLVPMSSNPWPEYEGRNVETLDVVVHANALPRILQGLINFANVIRNLLIFPDNKNLWIVGGVLAAIKIVKKHKIQYVLSSSPPFSSNIVGLLLKVIFRKLFLIVDLRDPFVLGSEVHRKDVIVGLKKRLLDCVVIRADLILVTTERSLRLLEKVCSDKIEKKVFILPNGITKNLFDHVKKQRAERAERILCHLGDLDYKHRNPEPLIKALHELISESRIRRSDVIVEFFGQSGTWNGNSIDDMAKVYGLQGIVRRYESVPHDTALAIMKNCDGLVLLAENQPDMIPAKTYEYLYSGRPILCFADKESATYNLLKDFNNVWLVNSKDMNSAKEAIEQLLNYPRGKERTLTETEMKKISFEHHLSEVIELFHKNERALEYACSEKRREESLRKIDAV